MILSRCETFQLELKCAENSITPFSYVLKIAFTRGQINWYPGLLFQNKDDLLQLSIKKTNTASIEMAFWVTLSIFLGWL